MNLLFAPHFTWVNLFATALTLAVIFILLKLFGELLKKAILPENIITPLRTGLKWILLFFEPAAALLLLVIFVFIRPELNGPVIALLLIGGFSHLRNYLSGFIMKMYESVTLGNRIRTPNAEGVVTFVGRLGLRLRTSEGQHFSNYTKLLSEGYTLVTGEEPGGFFHLNISSKNKEEGQNKSALFDRIYDLLASAPFLSPKYKPDLSQTLNNGAQFTAKILVDEEHHLHELIALLDEQGWQTTIK